MQFIIENTFGTNWFICDTALIQQVDNIWKISAERKDENNITHSVIWDAHVNSTQWLPKMSCKMYSSRKGTSTCNAQKLSLDQLIQVIIVSHSTTIGELYEYELLLKGNVNMTCYSWMGNFVTAWKSGELFLSK